MRRRLRKPSTTSRENGVNADSSTADSPKVRLLFTEPAFHILSVEMRPPVHTMQQISSIVEGSAAKMKRPLGGPEPLVMYSYFSADDDLSTLAHIVYEGLSSTPVDVDDAFVNGCTLHPPPTLAPSRPQIQPPLGLYRFVAGATMGQSFDLEKV